MNFFNPYFVVTEASGHGMKDVLDWYNATDSGSLYNGVHVVFIDFRKAFDLVDHGVLLTKFEGMGITMSFWKWTQSYLSDRTQQVKLPGVLSRHGEVIAGVPQGGVISLTLFNMHVNDIEDCIPRGIPISTCKYADDCTQYELVFKDSVSQMQIYRESLFSARQV